MILNSDGQVFVAKNFRNSTNQSSMLKFEPVIFAKFVKDIQQLEEQKAIFVTSDQVVNFGRIVGKD